MKKAPEPAMNTVPRVWSRDSFLKINEMRAEMEDRSWAAQGEQECKRVRMVPIARRAWDGAGLTSVGRMRTLKRR